MDPVDTAIASERDAATREHYHAQLTTIAERDIVTARIIRDMSLKQWNAALLEHRTDDARRWAERYAGAVRDENDAQASAAYYARERDQARADFEVSAAKLHRLERRASR